LIDKGMMFIKEGDYGNKLSRWVNGLGGGLVIMPDITFNFE